MLFTRQVYSLLALKFSCSSPAKGDPVWKLASVQRSSESCHWVAALGVGIAHSVLSALLDHCSDKTGVESSNKTQSIHNFLQSSRQLPWAELIVLIIFGVWEKSPQKYNGPSVPALGIRNASVSSTDGYMQ